MHTNLRLKHAGGAKKNSEKDVAAVRFRTIGGDKMLGSSLIDLT